MLLPTLYRRLLFLYPADFREEFGDEMAWVFERVHAEIRRESAFARVTFCAREMQGLLVGSVRERVRGLFDSQSPAAWKGGSMERKFRFPRATVVMMLLSLLVVVLSLEQARMIEIHYGSNLSIPPEWPMLLWIFARLLLIAAAVAAVVWGVFFALRRSGIQRLEELKPWREQK